MYKCTGVLAIPLNKDGVDRVLRAEAKRVFSSSGGDSETEDTDSDAASATSDSEKEEDEVQTPALTKRESFLATSQSLSPRSQSEIKRAENDPGRTGGGETRKELTAPGEHGTVGPDASAALPEGVAAGEAPHSDTSRSKWDEANKAELEDKLVREATRQWARGEMFFAYDFDLTTPLQRKHQAFAKSAANSSTSRPFTASAGGAHTKTSVSALALLEEPQSTMPLWRRADRRFFHNEHMVTDFSRAGLHSLVLPLMQGYFQVADLPLTSFLEADETDTSAQLLVVSRRSKERPGLRYQRRGINEDGQVANYVETEQVLCVQRGEQTHLFAFVQFRGSIPLYWSQSPFSLKPPPVLERNKAENAKACAKHFSAQIERYGKVTCINLAEQSGKEGEITEAYKQVIEDLTKPNQTISSTALQYHAFDFHKECAGMKFENVSRLIDQVGHTLDGMDCFWRSSMTGEGEHLSQQSATSNFGVMSLQQGTFRVSCLDCLDRTNVVQSAFGRHMLYLQLARIGLAKNSSSVKDEAFDFVFNDMWANNGDQVSQCYAGSRALKGDFTRTGRRNWAGMFNDATASVYRMVQGAVTDFWRQTVISFIYGELTLSGLEKYADELQTADPSNEMRLKRIRAIAIESCAEMVLPEGEALIGGWALFAPHEPNQIQSSKLEEKIMLLTSKAAYVCAYDFTAEKLSEYSRVLLGDVVGIRKGPYVISPKDSFHPEQHWGFVLSFLNESTRVNVASIKNVPPATNYKDGTNFVALKAIAHEFAGTMERHPQPSIPVPSTTQQKHNEGSVSTKGADRSDSVLSRSAIHRDLLLDHDHDESLTSKEIVEVLVGMLLEECAAAGAYDPGTQAQGDSESFVREESIQSLAEAKAQAPMFAGLLEGLKRRVWL